MHVELFLLPTDMFEFHLLLQNSKLLRPNTQMLYYFVLEFLIIGSVESLN